jgi:hypothetical protein
VSFSSSDFTSFSSFSFFSGFSSFFSGSSFFSSTFFSGVLSFGSSVLAFCSGTTLTSSAESSTLVNSFLDSSSEA